MAARNTFSGVFTNVFTQCSLPVSPPAAAVVDDTTPRILRIAGDSVTVRDIATTMSNVTGERYRPLWAGSLNTLGVMIRIAKVLAPQSDAAFPPWQGMQYMRDQFSGRVRLTQLDNGRYAGLTWTSVRDQLSNLNGIQS